MRCEYRHPLPGTPERFWQTYFDPAFVEKSLLEAMGCTRFTILEQSGDLAAGLHRRLESEQPIQAPAAVRSLVGEVIAYVEDGRFDPRTGRWRFTITPSVLADKVKLSGEQWVEPAPGGGIERVIAIDCSVNLFGLGGVLERFVAQVTGENYERQAAHMRTVLGKGRGARAGAG